MGIRRFQRSLLPALIVSIVSYGPSSAQSPMWHSADVYQLRSVEEAQISPDGQRIAYSVRMSDRPGATYAQLWVMDLATNHVQRVGDDNISVSALQWAPNNQWLAYVATEAENTNLMVTRPDGSEARVIAQVTGTNHPLPSAGQQLAWAPDAQRIAFCSTTPGPETEAAQGDPVVITRYLYKPSYNEGQTRFNDNRRMHIFVADLTTSRVRQLTDGNYYEHSVVWSPTSAEILFVSNREANPDRVFNYDVFAVNADDGKIRRITSTKSAEYQPQWSPDGRRIAFLGTKRTLTSSETTMEDTHVWIMNADGSDRRELGAAVDNRQGALQWSPDGQAVYVTVEERGSVHIYRMALSGAAGERVVTSPGVVGSWWSSGGWSVGKGSTLAFAFTTAAGPAELYLKKERDEPRQLTFLNKELLSTKKMAEIEPFTFKSFDGMEIEAFLTKPVDIGSREKHPMIVTIHGGPHGQQGPVFDAQAQVYAGLGWASLMVNYRGSTGYGQKLADAIFKDQDGGEAKDVLAAVDAALVKYPWIDAERLGVEGVSYGGQLTDWLITQTTRFKAAIPTAGISNLVSFNYMAYYHDYLPVEFGSYPHENGLIDLLWERSAIRYANKVKTPTMFLHGENDNDVPIAEAEQYYIALQDVGVETVMVRYPREGHGVRLETKHVADVIDRSVDWYTRHLDTTKPSEARPQR
jgi:dipeptidyl aminopeptidase/acylaminoacyl peptidase